MPDADDIADIGDNGDNSDNSDDAEPIAFRVAAGQEGRADAVVGRRFPDASRRRLAALFSRGAVRVDGRVVKKGDRIAAGARVAIAAPPETDADRVPVPEPDRPLDVLYADADLIAVAKPAGWPTYPLRAGERGTLAGALIARFPECTGVGHDPREAGLAHRLDIHTSGALLAARRQSVWDALRAAFGAGAITKRYLALVAGDVGDGASSVPLVQRGGRAVAAPTDPAALPARTTWRAARRAGAYTLLSCEAHTGRMHQIRAHLAHAGAPIAGDARYGGDAIDGLAGQFLHAAELALAHPVTGAPLRIEAPLPTDRAALLARLAR
jgi:23S rRNA pseudouridine1911/1915/1917 synthase